METDIEVRKLTDGSEAYGVVFHDGSNAVRINCEDKAKAEHIAGVLLHLALDAEVLDSGRRG